MSPSDRPQGEYRRAQPEGAPESALAKESLAAPSGHDEMCSRARALVPRWRERAGSVELARGLPRHAIDELHDAQLLQIITPGRHGGLGLEWHTVVETSRIAARACASTAWTISLIGTHVGIAARLPRPCQDAMFADGPRQLIATASAQTSGSILRETTGYRIRGMWRFSSGIDHATWLIVNGRVAEASPAKPADALFFVVRPDQVRIEDAWHVAGMRGTGSRDVHFDDTFVDTAWASPLPECFGPDPAGGMTHACGYLYRVPLLPYVGSSIIGPLLGCAEGAYDEFVALTAKRHGAGVPEQPMLLERLSESAAELTCARHLYESIVATLCDAGRALRALTSIEFASLRRDRTYLAKLCVNAVHRLMRQLGASGIFESNPMQRQWRDLQVMASHMDLNWDVSMLAFARQLLADATLKETLGHSQVSLTPPGG